jgi:hypothetical protein
MPPHLRSGINIRTSTSTSIATAYQNGYIPPHMRASISSSGAPAQCRSGYVPPHLRSVGNSSQNFTNIQDSDIASQSSVSNPYETGSTQNGSIYGWSLIDARRRNGLPVNTPGTFGPHQIQQRVPPSQTSSQSASEAPSQPNQDRDNGDGNWARAVSSHTFRLETKFAC